MMTQYLELALHKVARPPLALACLLGIGALSMACGNPYSGEISDTTELAPYQSCDELEEDLKHMLRGELQYRYLRDRADAPPFQLPAPGMAADGSVAMSERGETTPTDPTFPDEEGSFEDPHDFTETNNQEDGVDEADLVKTDGEHLYVLDGRALHIFGVPTFGELEPLSRTELDGQPFQLLIRRDRAIVFSLITARSLPLDHPLRRRIERAHDWRCEFRTADGDITTPNDMPAAAKLTVLDVSDRQSPDTIREIYMEGDYQTARRIDDTILVGFFAKPHVDALATDFSGSRREIDRQRRERLEQIDELALDDLLPRMYEGKSDGRYEPIELCDEGCGSFLRPSYSSGRGVTSILSFDIFEDTIEHSAQHVIGNRPVLYASRDRIYIAEAARDWWWYYFNESHPDQTNVHVFDIGGSGETEKLGSARVKGRALNQFSLSEHDGHLRMSTTEKHDMRWWEDIESTVENHVFVLSLDTPGGRLETAGHIEGIEPEEQIFSTRFIGEKGYIVTFPDQPQHGVDLLPPTVAEEICGSGATGVRRIDVRMFQGIDPLFTIDLSDPTDPRLIGDLKITGFSTYIHPVEDQRLLTVGVAGDDEGSTWGFQVSLFDVSDFSDPSLVDAKEILGEGDLGESEALFEHKAFTYFAPRGLLAVPVSSSEQVEVEHGWEWRHESRLELVSVDTTAGLSPYGVIDHSPLINQHERESLRGSQDVRRSFFMGDYIYTISDAGIMVNDIEHLTNVAMAAFER